MTTRVSGIFFFNLASQTMDTCILKQDKSEYSYVRVRIVVDQEQTFHNRQETFRSQCMIGTGNLSHMCMATM